MSKQSGDTPKAKAPTHRAIPATALPAFNVSVDAQVLPPNPTVDDSESEDIQSKRVEEIADEITAVRTAWRLERDAVYNALDLDNEARRALEHARALAGETSQILAAKIQESKNEERQLWIDRFQINREQYDAFAMQVLGEHLYSILLSAQARFNERLRTETAHGTMVEGDL